MPHASIGAFRKSPPHARPDQIESIRFPGPAVIGHAILSHGLESGPNATKVSALAAAAENLGWSTERPDYLAADKIGAFGDIDARISILRERARERSGVNVPIRSR